MGGTLYGVPAGVYPKQGQEEINRAKQGGVRNKLEWREPLSMKVFNFLICSF